MFRNAMLPQLTGLALALGGMVGGALITEMIFSYPGLGMAILTAIQGSDYPVDHRLHAPDHGLLSCSPTSASTSSSAWLDPRIRAAQAEEGA